MGEAEWVFKLRAYLQSHVGLRQVREQVQKCLAANRPNIPLALPQEEGAPLAFPTSVRALWVNRQTKVELVVDGDQYSIVRIPGVEWQLPKRQGALAGRRRLDGLAAGVKENAGVPEKATQVGLAFVVLSEPRRLRTPHNPIAEQETGSGCGRASGGLATCAGA